MKDKNYFINGFINKFILKKDIKFNHKPVCNHILIGSSLVSRLIDGKCTVKDVHGIYFTSKERWVGSLAEAAYKQDHCPSNIISHPFSISADLKYICAVPDFIEYTDDGDCKIIEIKSAESMNKCEDILESYQVDCQIQTALSVFNLKQGILAAMIRFNHYERYRLFSRRYIYNQNFLLSKKAKLLEGYLIFLTEYFQIFYNITIDEDDKNWIRPIFENDVKGKRKKRIYNTLDTIKVPHKISKNKHPNCLKLSERW